MDKELKDMIEPIPNWDYTYIYDGSRTCGKSYFQNLLDEKDELLQKIQKIVDNEKITGIEAKLMIKDVLEGK